MALAIAERSSDPVALWNDDPKSCLPASLKTQGVRPSPKAEGKVDQRLLQCNNNDDNENCNESKSSDWSSSAQLFRPPSLISSSEQKKQLSYIPPLNSNLPQIPPSRPPPEIDFEKDGRTRDSWIHRNPELLRLTGKHPFNCEAPLSLLFDTGFLTPSELFYVRNHGYVPRVSEEDAKNWRLEVYGECYNPLKLTLGDLMNRKKFRTITMPITMMCAGYRRKEQNVVKKSLGFSWGPGGISTALFTGILLSDLLKMVKPKRRKVKHVIFEGAEDLPDGKYGTSQRFGIAEDWRKGMMLVWGMNGLPLEPDHGFPLRLVVPGQIGGRSVKWLKKIELSQNESQHHLHFFDNKVLPTQLGPEQARAEKHWWYDPKYIINDCPPTSSIAHPTHDEILSFSSSTYKLQGHAYSGGGRRVNRVEISLDEGKSWRLAEVTYDEDLYRGFTSLSAPSDEHRDRSRQMKNGSQVTNTNEHNHDINDSSDLISSDSEGEDEDWTTDPPIWGHLDLTERETSFCWCFWSYEIQISQLMDSKVSSIIVRCLDEGLARQGGEMYWK